MLVHTSDPDEMNCSVVAFLELRRVDGVLSSVSFKGTVRPKI